LLHAVDGDWLYWVVPGIGAAVGVMSPLLAFVAGDILGGFGPSSGSLLLIPPLGWWGLSGLLLLPGLLLVLAPGILGVAGGSDARWVSRWLPGWRSRGVPACPGKTVSLRGEPGIGVCWGLPGVSHFLGAFD